MANQFSKGHVFVPGEVVDPDDLNNLVDLATALGPLVSSQPPVSADVADSIIISDASDSGNLKKALISTLPGAGTVTSVNWDIAGGYPAPTSVFAGSVNTPTTAPLIHLSMKVQNPGVVMAGPTSGSPTVPGFRALVPSDLPVGVNNISLVDIDWSTGLTFTKQLAGNITFTFSNPSLGQTIRVRVVQDVAPGLRTVTWPAALWPGGVHPVMTTGAGRIDIYTFTYINGGYYGTFAQNFAP